MPTPTTALDDVSQTRGCGAFSGSLACSRRPFLCVWKSRPVPLCVGLLAPLSAPLPSAVFFLAILRRALGIPPSTALAERQSPAALALVVERSSPASAVASFGQSSHYQPVGVLCAAGQRFVVQRHFVHQPRSSTATLVHVEVKYGTVTLALPFQSTSARLRAAGDAARCPFGANTTRPLINGFGVQKHSNAPGI